MKSGKKPQEKLKTPRQGTINSAVRNFITKDGFFLSAGIAYYGLFSIVPLAALTVSVVGLFIGSSTAESEISEGLTKYIGEDAADLLSTVFQDMSSRASLAGTIIGALLLLYGATRLFLKLQTSFNIMWGVRLARQQTPMQLFRSRLLTFSMILLPAAILFVAFASSTGIAWLSGHGWLPWLQKTVEAFAPFLVTWVAIAILMIALPDIRLRLRDCWATSLLAAVLCYATTRVFGAWLGWSSDSSRIVLTSVSVLMTLIVWVNIIAIILLFCVSITRVRYEAAGKTIQPYRYAARYHVTLDAPQAKRSSK